MSKNSIGNTRQFTLSAGNHGEFTFHVTLTEFNRFLRDAQRDVGMAANNFLLRTCTERESLAAAFEENWGLPLQLVEPIQEELIEPVKVVVKKQGRAPSN